MQCGHDKYEGPEEDRRALRPYNVWACSNGVWHIRNSYKCWIEQFLDGPGQLLAYFYTCGVQRVSLAMPKLLPLGILVVLCMAWVLQSNETIFSQSQKSEFNSRLNKITPSIHQCSFFGLTKFASTVIFVLGNFGLCSIVPGKSCLNSGHFWNRWLHCLTAICYTRLCCWPDDTFPRDCLWSNELDWQCFLCNVHSPWCCLTLSIEYRLSCKLATHPGSGSLHYMIDLVYDWQPVTELAHPSMASSTLRMAWKRLMMSR